MENEKLKIKCKARAGMVANSE